MLESKIHELYKDAQSKAKKEYNRRKSMGQSGHLTSLDGVLKDIDIAGNVYLGTHEIELGKIVGTYYHTRRMAFSKQFLPLESERSEFASKWMALCEAHLTEGIRDPIKVYEYLNHYYVVEGNKRVSVLKYYDAYKVSAEITRLIPKYDETDETIVLYYAYLEFYNQTKILDLWLSRPLRYKRLLKYLSDYEVAGIEPTEKFRHFMKEVYRPFKRIYLEYGGDTLSTTTGDAFLLYAKLYGIPQSLDASQVRAIMPSLVKEYSLLNETEETEIITDSDEVDRVPFFDAISTIFLPKKIRVGFVYARTIKSSGWTYSHELGRRHLEEQFSGRVETAYIENVPEDYSAYDHIKAFAQRGFDVVFTTSEVFKRATIKCAVEMPKVKFFNCSGSRPYVHMSNYFGRTYEARFLSGMIAGALTKTGIVGYTATDPNPEVMAGINAFALGMKMANPYSRLLVKWTGEWNNPRVTTDLSRRFVEMGADLISNKTLLVPRDVTIEYGVYSMLCSIDPSTGLPKDYLASPIWKWGIFYEKIIASILSGTYQKMTSGTGDNQKLVNFWWGMETGVIDLYLAEDKLPTETQRLVKLMKQMLVTEQLHPFTGPIYDTTGHLRVAKNEMLSAMDILNMDWLLDNVEVIDQEK